MLPLQRMANTAITEQKHWVSERPVYEAIWDQSILGGGNVTSKSSKERMRLVESRNSRKAHLAEAGERRGGCFTLMKSRGVQCRSL